MYIIAVSNQKGGCGKTTTSINLSAALAAFGKKVLLIDFDPQAHTTSGVGLDPEAMGKSMYDVLSSLTKEKASLSAIIKNIKPNMDIAPSNILLGTLEQELSDEIGREARLVDALTDIKECGYDYVLIDCPPNLGFLTINALRAANEVLIPLEMSFFSFNGINKLVDVINLVRDRLNHNIDYRVLLTMFDSRLQYSFRVQEEINSRFAGKLYGTIIHTNVKLREAASNGKPVMDYDKYCRGSKDYQALAREILNRLEPQKPLEEGWTPKNRVFAKDASPSKKTVGRDMPERVVEFVLSDPGAKEVYVAGDFNDWRISAEAKLEKRNGVWVKSLPLHPGRYRYRFVVDGKWMDDPNNPIKEKNPFGELDSLLNIG